MHYVWLIPTSSIDGGTSDTALRRNDTQEPIFVDLVNMQLSPVLRRYAGTVLLSDKVRLLQSAHRFPPHVPMPGKPQRWECCCSPTMCCIGDRIEFGTQHDVAMTIMCTFYPTPSNSCNSASEMAAMSFVAAAVASLLGPTRRVLADNAARSATSSSLAVLVAWRAAHAVTLMRWASRCARWLQKEPSRLHGVLLDADTVCRDTMVSMSLAELEAIPPRQSPGARAADLASQLVMTSAQRRRQHFDPDATQPVPATRSTDDASLRSAWQQLMALSHGFVERPQTPSSTLTPPSSHVQYDPTLPVAVAHVPPTVIPLSVINVAQDDDVVQMDTDGSSLESSPQPGEHPGGVRAAVTTSPLSHAPVKGQAGPQSTEWFFHRNVTVNGCDDNVVMASSAESDEHSDTPVDEDRTFTCCSTSRATAAASRFVAWPIDVPPPLRVVVRESVTLRAHCTATDAIPRHHSVDGVLQVCWAEDASAVLKSCTPPGVVELSLQSGLPLEGYWRMFLSTSDTKAGSASAESLAAFQLTVRVAARWTPPKEFVISLPSPRPDTATHHSMGAGDSSTTSSSSSTDSEDEDNSSHCWCPGDWAWAAPKASEADSNQGRDVEVVLACNATYDASLSPITVATFALGSFRGDNQLRRALRAYAPTYRPTIAALREMQRHMEQSWMPVDCRGRWILEQAHWDPPSEDMPLSVSLQFKGIIALRMVPSVALLATCPVTCTFHPRVAVPASTSVDSEVPPPTLSAHGRPEFDILKCKPRSGMGTVGWRDIAQACSHTLGTAEANLLRLPVAARVVYSEPQVVQELLRSAADGVRGHADPHAALHVRFVDAPLPSVSGVMVVASCVHALLSPLPVTTLLSSGKEYTFDFDRAQLLRR
jgi:hypothetical protein